ncbi:hypothetical protein JCM3770_005412 [Rhodotorula araucariae]
MAALNWAMLTPQGDPVPLPGEKFLWRSSPSIGLSLFPHPPGSPLSVQPARDKDQEYKATAGTLHVSQKRIVYVAPGAPSTSGPGGGAPGNSSASDSDRGSLASGQASHQRPPLHTLSVPIRSFVDGRFVQPWFTAAYYEALCLEGDGSGGLDMPHLVRFFFKESGGYDFYTAVEEVKARAEMASDRRGTPVEQLLPVPVPILTSQHAACPRPAAAYEAPPSSDSRAPSAPPRAPLATPHPAAAPASLLAAPPPPPPARQMAPSPAALVAAQVAAEADESEQRALEERCQAEGPPPVPGEGEGDDDDNEERDAPPGYSEA